MTSCLFRSDLWYVVLRMISRIAGKLALGMLLLEEGRSNFNTVLRISHALTHTALLIGTSL